MTLTKLYKKGVRYVYHPESEGFVYLKMDSYPGYGGCFKMHGGKYGSIIGEFCPGYALGDKLTCDRWEEYNPTLPKSEGEYMRKRNPPTQG